MTDTPIDMGMVSDTSPPSPPASTATPQLRPSAPLNPRSVGHSPARDRYAEMRSGTDGAPVPAETGADGPDPEAPPAIDQTKHKVGKYEVSEAELAGMMDRQAQDDLRKATLPTAPDAYKLELPEGTTLPDNIAVQFDANDPGMIAARNWAHARGIDQQGFSEVLAIYASHVAQQEANLAERSRAEIAKAGANGPQRVDAVGRWITSLVGEADAKPIRATLVTDSHLRFYEKLMTQHVSQGTAPFSQQHRVIPERGIPGYENLSFEQRRHAQEQRAAATRRG
jgi:hypothetical protein